VATHDGFDGLCRFIRVVERDGANIVVKDVGFDDAMEETAANEAELPVNGCGSATNVGPTSSGVVGERWVGVLEVGDRN
jgi:hypothetical protein